MPMPLPAGAPEIGAYIVYIGFGVGGLFAAFQGWKASQKPSTAPNALIAGDIMDTRPMKDLAEGVGRLNEQMVHLAAAEDRRAAADDRKSAALDRNTDAVRDLCLTIERKIR